MVLVSSSWFPQEGWTGHILVTTEEKKGQSYEREDACSRGLPADMLFHQRLRAERRGIIATRGEKALGSGSLRFFDEEDSHTALV